VGIEARLTEADIACWVVKSQKAPTAVAPGWRPGSVQQLTRCLRRSYRLELMRPGQRCLFWLSGRDQPGIHAIGTLVGLPPTSEAEVAVSLQRLHSPVPRADLVADHLLSRAEVIRMPAGSNPSYLTPDQLDRLRDYIQREDWSSAGW
jgi:hypothetical protein